MAIPAPWHIWAGLDFARREGNLMTSGHARGFYRDLELIAKSGTATGLTDAELIDRVLRGRGAASEAAFEAIVAKHGPMVLSVCRGLLRDSSEADDAFQATFLVLVRKAGSVKLEPSLAPWLYGVARRVALKARSAAWRRGQHEITGVDADSTSNPEIETRLLDAVPLLYDELDRLPEKYRFPVVLCHLEGLSHEEAARQLDWPVGTLSGRLSRARDLLRTRLTRRGVGVSPRFVAGTLTLAKISAVPPALLRSTTLSAAALVAGGSVSTSIVFLMQGALTAMFVSKLKIAGILLASLFLITTTAGYVAGQIGAGKPADPVAAQDAKPALEKAPPTAAKPEPPFFAGEFDAQDEGKKVTNPAEIPGFPKMSERERILRGGTGGGGGRPSRIPSLIFTSDIVSVTSKDKQSISAMVVDVGTWDTYQTPAGVQILPISSNIVMALALSGDEIPELAAICMPSDVVAKNPRPGTFIKHKLEKPAKGRAAPTVGPAMAFYQIGNDVHAFSSATNSWDSIALGGDEAPTVKMAPKALIAEQGDTVYVFGLNTGKWSEGLKLPKADESKTKDQ